MQEIYTGASLILITVLIGVISHLIRRRRDIKTEEIYDIPNETKPESFNMTQSSVYGIHEK